MTHGRLNKLALISIEYDYLKNLIMKPDKRKRSNFQPLPHLYIANFK